MLFLVLVIGTAYLADRLTGAAGIADPEREQFALVYGLLLGSSMLLAVPLTGRLLGQASATWPGAALVLPFVLAAVAAYAIFADNRSGHYFETDHALPEIVVPLALVLLASARVGHRLSVLPEARRAWSALSILAAVSVVALLAMTLQKTAGGGGGMYQLDSPLTAVVLAVVAVYAITAPMLPNPRAAS